MRYIAVPALGSLLFLAGCGGGSGGSGVVATPTPTPTPGSSPTPAPTPSPTPTPSPSYATFDGRAGDWSSTGQCAEVIRGAAGTIPVSTGTGESTLAYTAASRTYSLGGRSFGPSTLQPGQPAGVTFYNDPNGDTLTLIRSAIGGASLDFVREVLKNFSTMQAGRRYWANCVAGVPTQATDLPSAVVSYTLQVSGIAYDQAPAGSVVEYRLDKSTASLTYDPGNRSVRGTLHLIGTPASGSDLDLGSFDLVGTVDATTSSFQLTTVQILIGGHAAGSGGLFGPRGTEVGFTFGHYRYDVATNASNSTRQVNATVVGIARPATAAPAPDHN